MEKKIKILSIVMLSIGFPLLAFGLTWIYFYNTTFMESLWGSISIGVGVALLLCALIILPDQPLKDNEEFINGFHAGVFYRVNDIEPELEKKEENNNE